MTKKISLILLLLLSPGDLTMRPSLRPRLAMWIKEESDETIEINLVGNVEYCLLLLFPSLGGRRRLPSWIFSLLLFHFFFYLLHWHHNGSLPPQHKRKTLPCAVSFLVSFFFKLQQVSLKEKGALLSLSFCIFQIQRSHPDRIPIICTYIKRHHELCSMASSFPPSPLHTHTNFSLRRRREPLSFFLFVC